MPNDLPELSGEPLSKDDILDGLSVEDDSADTTEEDTDETEGKGKGKGKETEEDESADEDEDKVEIKDGELADEEEDKEPTDDQLELTVPVKRKEILAKYPTLFKDFPYLERAYYREQQYTELFPTLDDAKETAQKAQAFDGYEAEIMRGNTDVVLAAIKKNDPKAFARTVDNYLPNLAKVDEQAYYHVIGNTIRTVIGHMVAEAKNLGKENGEPLQIAAEIVNQFAFGNSKITQPTKLVTENPEANTEAEQLKRERVQFVKDKFNHAHNDLVGKVQNSLKSTIDAHIDPRQSMTDYVRKNATKDAYEELESLMGQDGRFKTIMDKLWERAFDDNFSRKSLDAVRAAYLSKAKILLPTVIKNARNVALKGHKAKSSSDKRAPLPVGRSTTSTSSANKPSTTKQVPSGMKTLDYLMQD